MGALTRQLALDISPAKLPIALSVSLESYTNSADPTNPYEISRMFAVNLLYADRIPGFDEVRFFIGGGMGRLKVPVGEQSPGLKLEAGHYNLEAGIGASLWRGLGLYGAVKYIHAEKKSRAEKVIDFNEIIVLLGLTYRFGL